MAGSLVCLVTLTLGMDAGWRQLPDGGMEYIIQIEPHVLEALRGGEEIESDIPPALRGVRRYRIRVGTDELPREGKLEPGPELSPGPGGWPCRTIWGSISSGLATGCRGGHGNRTGSTRR